MNPHTSCQVHLPALRAIYVPETRADLFSRMPHLVTPLHGSFFVDSSQKSQLFDNHHPATVFRFSRTSLSQPCNASGGFIFYNTRTFFPHLTPRSMPIRYHSCRHSINHESPDSVSQWTVTGAKHSCKTWDIMKPQTGPDHGG